MEFLLHLLTPRSSNNHRAKVLHPSVLSLIIVALVGIQLLFSLVGRVNPQILGYASNITVSDLLKDTNQKRTEAQISPLTLSEQLSSAAKAKGEDMFANQYWAHVSPQGKDPWSWIVASGYNYVFAGENLARDFGDSQSVVDAWMNSPSHKENLLNNHFSDVGFAVVNGKYNNGETTIVIQMFGSRSQQQPTVESPQISPATQSSVPVSPPPTNGIVLNTKSPSQPDNKVHLDIMSLTKNISVAVLVVLILVLALDALLVYKRKIIRLSGHNTAHILLLLAVLIALNLIGRGLIL